MEASATGPQRVIILRGVLCLDGLADLAGIGIARRFVKSLLPWPNGSPTIHILTTTASPYASFGDILAIKLQDLDPACSVLSVTPRAELFAAPEQPLNDYPSAIELIRASKASLVIVITHGTPLEQLPTKLIEQILGEAAAQLLLPSTFMARGTGIDLNLLNGESVIRIAHRSPHSDGRLV